MSDELLERGRRRRREVLGDAHVERSEASASEFTRDFQELLTRFAWGDVWSRPGLDQRTRQLITIAMLVALNREEELRLHLRAARDAGISREELKEVLLQTAVYCGIPAANAAFRAAAEILG